MSVWVGIQSMGKKEQMPKMGGTSSVNDRGGKWKRRVMFSSQLQYHGNTVITSPGTLVNKLNSLSILEYHGTSYTYYTH